MMGTQASVLRGLTEPTTAVRMGITSEEPLSEHRLSGRLISLAFLRAAEGCSNPATCWTTKSHKS